MENESGSVAPTADTSTEVVFGTPPASGAEEQKPEGDPGAKPEETTQETTEQQEARKQSKFQRRLERQKTARIQAETELRITKERLASLEAQSQQKPESGEPQRDQFESYEAYIEARAEWRADQKVSERLKADREASQAREQQGQRAAGQEKVAQEWAKRESEFQKATPDYLEVVTPFVDADGELHQLSAAAKAAIVELGPEVLHHLAKNLDIVERIADLSPVRQVAEIGKLDVKAEKPAPKPSKAPAPITR